MLTADTAFFNQCEMSDFKSIKQLIDEYYPEIAERLNNGERNGK